MELRRLESSVNELRQEYERIRKSSTVAQLPALVDEDVETEAQASKDASVWQQLRDLVPRKNELIPKIDKWKRRKTAIDPVTEEPRYNAATQDRIQLFLDRFQELESVLDLLTSSQSDDLVKVLQDQHEELIKTRQLAEQQAKEQKEREAAAERQRIEQERQQREQEHQQVLEQQRQEAEAVREARMQYLQERQETDRVDREWQDSIPKGVAGVKEQLDKLPAQAIRSVHQLFTQIVARPEETQFRRIRRNHPQFHNDIGQYTGGAELLIAAGFRCQVVGEEAVPSYVMSEPNMEKDMDAWAAWFDSLQATVTAIEERL